MTICYWFAVWEAYQRAPLAWSRCGALSGALRGVQASGVLIAQHRLNKQPGCDLIIRGASRRAPRADSAQLHPAFRGITHLSSPLPKILKYRPSPYQALG